jgi:regulator of cell morphogenesis and NO signaling
MNIQQCTLGEIVTKDARAAAILEQYQIDFCCNGHRTLQQACPDAEKAQAVTRALTGLTQNANTAGGPAAPTDSSAPAAAPAIDYRGWPLDLLADFIEKKYHRETTRQIDVIQAHLDKICRVHGETHPELWTVKGLFEESAAELTMHMKKEELMLFPFIRKMVQNGKPPLAPFGTVDNPIRALTHEHQAEGERFRQIAELTDDYIAPADGCQTYRLTYHELKEFESMLHFHIHLENNLLFPRALEMAETSQS